MKYIEQRELHQRDQEGRPAPFVSLTEPMLVGTENVMDWVEKSTPESYDHCELYPAFSTAGGRFWLVTRVRVYPPTTNHPRERQGGHQEQIIPFQEGVELLIKQGRFDLPYPQSSRVFPTLPRKPWSLTFKFDEEDVHIFYDTYAEAYTRACVPRDRYPGTLVGLDPFCPQWVYLTYNGYVPVNYQIRTNSKILSELTGAPLCCEDATCPICQDRERQD